MDEAITARPRGLPDNEKKILLLTTVDIGDGRSAKIEVREGEDPLEIAARFCQEHGLPDGIVGHLAVHILENLAQAVLEEVQEADEEQQPAADHYPNNPFLQDNDSMSSDLTDSDIEDQYYTETESDAPLHIPSSSHHQQPHPLPTVPKVDPSLPAHDRLYCEHFRREMLMEQRRQIRDLELQASMGQIHATPLSKALTANRDASGYSNYGERLYIEGRMDAMKKEKEIEAARIAAEEAEVAGATFHPQITALALEMKKKQQRDVAGFDISVGGGAAAGGSNGGQKMNVGGDNTTTNGGSSSTRGYTPWNRLYKLSSVAEQRRKARIEALERERKEAELAECKFKPQIDPRSARMAANRAAALAENGMGPYDLLYNEADKRRRKLEEAAKKTPEEATFMPVINKDFFSSKNRRPTSGKSTERDGSNSSSDQQQQDAREEEEPTDVALRLLNKGRMYQERLQAAREALEKNPIDPNTGRPLFKPHTRPAPTYLSNKERISVDEDDAVDEAAAGVKSARRNPGDVPIGEYLYSVKQLQDQKAQEMKNAALEAALRAASEPKLNPKSEQLMERIKQERFRAIFEYLQTQQQQPQPTSSSSAAAAAASINLVAIVSDEAFMDTIDPEVRADVEYAAQLFFKSQEKKLASNSVVINRIKLPEFAALMDKVLSKTRGLARQYLLPTAQRRQKFEQPTFKPVLDARSLALAAKRMRPADGLPGHEVLYKTAEVVAAKKEVAKRELEAARMAECTFRPTTTSSRVGSAANEAIAPRYNAMYRQSDAQEKDAVGVIVEAPNKDSIVGEGLPDFFNKEVDGEKRMNADVGQAVVMEKEEHQPPPQQQKNRKSKQQTASIDDLENQINNVLARLSLTGQRLAQGLQEAEANPALLKSSFDYAALFGSREGSGGGADNTRASDQYQQQQQQPHQQKKAALPSTSLSSWAGFNPMQADEDGGMVVMGDLTPVSGNGGKASLGGGAVDDVEGSGDSIPAVHSSSPTRKQQHQQDGGGGGGGGPKGERGSLRGLKLAELASL